MTCCSTRPWRGATWVEAYCVRLARYSETAQECNGADAYCHEFVATQADYDNLTSKYGFNMAEYYKSALDCAINAGEDGEPNLFGLPEDGPLAVLVWDSGKEREGELQSR